MNRLRGPATTLLPAVLAIGGCATTVTVEPAQPIGPTLVLDVANASDDDHRVGYEFAMNGAAGEGEGTAIPCERIAQPYGEIAGPYTVTVDGEPVLEATVPQNAPAGRYLVVRVSIAPDGTATVAPPVLLAAIPDTEPRPIGGCG